MKITVILCTYNRCRSLAKALESVAALELAESDQWEVLVVDNNSRDQTLEVVEDFCHRYPGRFRYLFEPQQGKSYALNSGIREARGDVLAFTDDDITVEPAWLQNLTAALRDGEWAGTGGRVLLERGFSPPSWLSRVGRYALTPLGTFDLGTEARDLIEPPFGNSMAFRRDMFEKYGGFRTDLGPRPDSEMRGEDTEFGRRLLDGGERLRYEPSAVAYHTVPQNRIRKEYFLAYWFDKARADIRAYGSPPDYKCSVASIPLVLFRRLVVWALRWMVAVEQSRRFSCKVNAWMNAGMILECYRRSRRPSRIRHGV